MRKMTERRRALIAAGKVPRLPSEYQEVEWIQTDGSSIFEWDGIPGYVPYFESKLYSPAQGEWVGLSFGRNVNNAVYIGSVSTNNPVFRVKNSQNPASLVSTISVYSPATQKYSADGWYINDVLLGSDYNVSVLPTKVLIGAKWPTLAYYQVRFFYMNTYASDGTPLMSLVPCYRKSDGVKGIYDMIGGTFNTGGSNNNYVVGPDV